jgi:ATP-binding cassette, subfamily C (CFTR/MRP), member 1
VLIPETTVEVETNIVSVERVLEYTRLPSEAPEIIHRHRPPISWPAKGAVEFHNYSTRYREGLDLVLKNISLSIKPHEKIGVVGRTGAGKSSLTLALFRIIEPVEGNISIDDLNTSTIGLLDLRRRLAIIPQDAALFEGTIRDNLDPGGIHDDTELWSVLGKSSPITPATYQHILCAALISLPAFSAYALQLPSLTPDSTEHARLKDHVASMSGGLEAKIHEGGMSIFHTDLPIVSLIAISFTCATASTSSTNLDTHNPDSHKSDCSQTLSLAIALFAPGRK